jgi:hypothetical protein
MQRNREDKKYSFKETWTLLQETADSEQQTYLSQAMSLNRTSLPCRFPDGQGLIRNLISKIWDQQVTVKEIS